MVYILSFKLVILGDFGHSQCKREIVEGEMQRRFGQRELLADMEEVIGKEWKMVKIETRRRSKRQRKDLRGAVGGWENIGLRTGRDGSNRYEEDTIGTVELEGCQKKAMSGLFQIFLQQTPLRICSTLCPDQFIFGQRSDENYKKVLQSVMKETAQKCGWTK